MASSRAWIAFAVIGSGILWLSAKEGGEVAQYEGAARVSDVATPYPGDVRQSALDHLSAPTAYASAFETSEEAEAAAAAATVAAAEAMAAAEYSSRRSNSAYPRYSGYSGYSGLSGYGVDEEEEREPFDEDAARDAAERDLAYETYRGAGRTYGCTDDCSGHEAGFKWRRDRGYMPSYSDSRSFRQGAQAFENAVEERVEELRDDYDMGYDPDY
jgi:pyruvate/2-oxoglutarate dehydrogenase complex dihydrolipoamide acyltransferase (E2) component